MECIIFLENTKFQECIWSAWILVCKWSPGSAFGVRTFQQKKMWECVGVRWRILECVWSAHSLRTAMHCKRTFQPQGAIKKYFFISHNIRRCHTSNVLNHPADLSGMDFTSDPSWFTHSPGKASTKRYSPQIFKGSLLFSLSTANKIKQILCVICFDTKWLSVLFKTVIIQSDDHNVPHYAYKTTAHV